MWPFKKKLQLKDIPDYGVLATHERYHKEREANVEQAVKDNPGLTRFGAVFKAVLKIQYPEDILHKEYGWPIKLINKKQEQLADKGYLEYGVNISGAWLTEKGEQYLKELRNG